MIEVVAKDEERSAPATTAEELFDRLSVYAGNSVKIHRPASRSTYSATSERISVGILQWLELSDDRSSVNVCIGEPNSKSAGKEGIRLIDEVSVLIDGGWKKLHWRDAAPRAEGPDRGAGAYWMFTGINGERFYYQAESEDHDRSLQITMENSQPNWPRTISRVDRIEAIVQDGNGIWTDSPYYVAKGLNVECLREMPRVLRGASHYNLGGLFSSAVAPD